jgi:hypothetical protein
VDWFVTTLIRTPRRAPVQKGRVPISLNVALLQEMEQPGGAARVGERLMEARRKDPNTQWWPWVVGNVLGTDHLMAGDNKLAINLYRLNVLAYPASADGLDSLADAYLADGQKDLARQYTERRWPWWHRTRSFRRRGANSCATAWDRRRLSWESRWRRGRADPHRRGCRRLARTSPEFFLGLV